MNEILYLNNLLPSKRELWDQMNLTNPQSKTPNNLACKLGEIVTRYNSLLESLKESYPLTVEAYWQNYGRNGERLFMDGRRFSDDEKQPTLVFGRPIIYCGGISLEDDSELSKKIMESVRKRNESNPCFIDFHDPFSPILDKSNIQLGLRTYEFKIGKGIRGTIWDLRQDSIPQLEYFVGSLF